VAVSTNAIVLFPYLGSTLHTLKTLVHEMVHLAVGAEHGHRAPFQKAAAAVGLTPPWREAPASSSLMEHLKRIAAEVGPMPAPFDTEEHLSTFIELPDGDFVLREDFVPRWVPPRKGGKA
jgi:hypothetical protein